MYTHGASDIYRNAVSQIASPRGRRYVPLGTTPPVRIRVPPQSRA
jgi:hypothetical protein